MNTTKMTKKQLSTQRDELLAACKRATKLLADYNGCGQIEGGPKSPIALDAQQQCFKAVARAEPSYYGIDPKNPSWQDRNILGIGL